VAAKDNASYAVVLGVYAAFTGGLSLAVRRWRRGSVHVPKLGDVALLGLATFRLSRLVSKEKVLAPVREPFVERTEPGQQGELNSEPAGTGVRRAFGELLTCPFCVAVWIATALTALFAAAPRIARLVAGGLSAVVVADWSQHAYAGLREQDPRTAPGGSRPEVQRSASVGILTGE
jgi:hypothetical protein